MAVGLVAFVVRRSRRDRYAEVSTSVDQTQRPPRFTRVMFIE
jgi:hypothetical protein